MLKYLVLCFLVLEISNGVLGQRICNDCTLFNKCEAAVNQLRNDKGPQTQNLIRSAFCGSENVQGRLMHKVCCSKFPPISSNNINSRLGANRKKGLLPEKCGSILGNRIVGGRKAKLYEFPWMALISFDTREGLQFQCGGSIINSKYILTAAHCVLDKKIAGVRVGEYNIDTETDCNYDTEKTVCEDHIQDLYVKDIIPHKNFNRLPTENDIALLRVDGEIFFNYSNVYPICLPTSPDLRNIVLDKKLATVAGWGYTEKGIPSPELLTVEVPIKSTAECKGFYNRNKQVNLNKQFCAGDLRKDSCNGDSGGPLMIKENYNNVNSFVQYGIVSHGPVQCGSNFPGFYTDVREFMDWILDNIKE